MSNYKKTKAEVYNYIRARSPLIIVDSPERERVERMLREISVEMSMEILYYTDLKQVVNIAGDSVVSAVDSDPLPHIADCFRKKRSATFVIGDVRRVGDDNGYSRELLNILYLAKENNGTLILITSDAVWRRLAQFGMIASLDCPDTDERTDQINAFIKAYRGRYKIDWEAGDVQRAATLLRGFTEIQIENILSTAVITDNGLFRNNIYELTGQKSRLYQSVPSVRMVHVSPSLRVSGLDALKNWLQEKKAIFFAPDEELGKRDLQTPKGILLAGVPGCGKSFSARMIAWEWELPLFRFDIGTVYDKWVGESEKRMKEALQFIDNVAPCILWIDEIEKALSISDTGNDTGKRVLGQFLFWLQESDSRVFLVATANDISLLPAELFRKGRFSEVFFIDLPNARERREAILLYAGKSLHIGLEETEIEELAAVSIGFSYSDIEYAIKDAAQMAIVNGQEIITHKLLLERFRAVVPISKSNPALVERIRRWGRERASLASTESGG